ncbi:MAG TPA: hypothetical protein VHC94_09770 [Nitrobacter sp.]|nr:hypothetical protein [Nitrobacter sp.]
MTKYASLGAYLRRQSANRIPMTFAEIEKIVGGKLPASQRYPAWWSNNPMNNTMTRVWLDAGFETEQVDVTGRKLVFRRVASGAGTATVERAAKEGGVGEHPLFARIRGTVHIPDGVDLTSPADPDWGDLDYGSSMNKEQA